MCFFGRLPSTCILPSQAAGEECPLFILYAPHHPPQVGWLTFQAPRLCYRAIGSSGEFDSDGWQTADQSTRREKRPDAGHEDNLNDARASSAASRKTTNWSLPAPEPKKQALEPRPARGAGRCRSLVPLGRGCGSGVASALLFVRARRPITGEHIPNGVRSCVPNSCGANTDQGVYPCPSRWIVRTASEV